MGSKIDMFCSGAQPKASAARSAHGTAMQKEEAASWQEAKQYSDRTGLTTKQKKTTIITKFIHTQKSY